MSPRPPTLLDLFSGCGGLSLGFHDAGFHVVGGVDANPDAAAVHGINFHPGALDLHGVSRDIRNLDPLKLVNEYGLEGELDVLVGGPPCQAFARVGRAKLRQVAANPKAWLEDERAGLYEHYLRFVAALRPRALVMENVPDILNFGGKNVAEEICSNLDDLGYRVRYTLLNAASFGVPQLRERFVLAAVREDVSDRPIEFPKPLHDLSGLPSGYRAVRAFARQNVQESLLGGSRFRGTDQHSHIGLPQPSTVRDAIADLPRITGHLTVGRSACKPGDLPYDAPAESAYAKRMRRGAGPHVTDHAIRWLPRDYPIFRAMNPGGEYPHAVAVAEALFEEERARRGIDAGSTAAGSLRSEMVPPYDPGKFPNKWRKLEWDAPSRTLLAHLGHDSYTHIHPDSRQARTISVREAARLQSFPDSFRLLPSMNASLKMIGNAVPPLLAQAVAEQVLLALDDALAPARSRCGDHDRARAL